MESISAENIVYKINGLVASVKEHTKSVYMSGFGKDAVFIEESLGWFLHLNGSHEALYLGKVKPNLNRGDIVSIIIQKEPNTTCPPSPNTNPTNTPNSSLSETPAPAKQEP